MADGNDHIMVGKIQETGNSYLPFLGGMNIEFVGFVAFCRVWSIAILVRRLLGIQHP